VTITKGGFDQI